MKFLKITLFVLLTFLANCKSLTRLADSRVSTFEAQIETDEPNKEETYQEVLRVLENRANKFGIDAEFSTPDKTGEFTVKIYQPNDIERIKKFLFTTYRLELKKIVSVPSPSLLAVYPSAESVAEIVKENQTVLPYVEKGESYVIVEKQSIITGRDIKSAEAVSRTGNNSDYQIIFNLKPEAATKFGEWTGKNINNYLAIVLDDKVLMAPYIRGQILEQGQIDGRFTKQEAEDISLSLNSGYLPAKIKLLSETDSSRQPK